MFVRILLLFIIIIIIIIIISICMNFVVKISQQQN